MEVVNAIDLVYKNPILKKFWRAGTLVENTTDSHPYQANVPKEYRDAPRWFLLNADINHKGTPSRKWKTTREIPVFSIALQLGTPPDREWLVYAFSPLEKQQGVKIGLPGYDTISINTTPSGVFYHISAKDKIVQKLPY